MRTLLTGQQYTPALYPSNRAFFLFFIFIFWREFIFFKKKIIFSLFFLSFSLSFSLVHTLWVLLSLMNFTKDVKENSKKVLHTNYRSIHASGLSTDQVGLSNNNPHWNFVFRFLFYPDLIQGTESGLLGAFHFEGACTSGDGSCDVRSLSMGAGFCNLNSLEWLTEKSLTPSRLQEQRSNQSHKVGREEEGMSSNHPELVTLRECLETHADNENLLYLTDSETTLQAINKWIGGAKLSLE